MANPTANVPESCTAVIDEKSTLSCVTTAQIYYPMEMLGWNASGLLDKFDDASSLRFAGVFAEAVRKEITSSSTAADRKLNVRRPRFISMLIASAAAGDEGKACYARFSNEVRYTTGTYGNYVGRVHKVVDSTHVLIDTLAVENRDANLGLTLAATGNDTLTKNHLNRRIIIPNTAAKTITLPAVAVTQPGDWMEFIKTTSDAFAFTLDGASSETINGATTMASPALQYSSIYIVSDGAAWTAIGESNTSFAGDVYIENTYGLIVGHTAQLTISNGDGATDMIPEVQILGTAKVDGSLLLAVNSATATSAAAPSVNFLKSAHATLGSNTVVASGEVLGEVNFFGADGTDFESCAVSLRGIVNTTPGAGDMPGRFVVFISADGAETPLEKVRVTGAAATAVVTLGVAGTSTGSIALSGATSGTVTIQPLDAAGGYTLTLPPDDGDAGEQLQTNGSGVMTWEAAGSMRAVKNILANISDKAQEALDRVMSRDVYAFQYKQDARKDYGLPALSDTKTVFQGIMAEEYPEVMMRDGKIFNPISAFGELMLAIKALTQKVDRLEAAAIC